MTVTVTIDPTALLQQLRERGGTVEAQLRAVTERVEEIARREAPGSMGDFVSSRIEATAAGLEGVITCDHPATRLVLDGTRPHLIRPRRAKALRFEIATQVVFARLVRHPGTKANDFLGRALEEGR